MWPAGCRPCAESYRADLAPPDDEARPVYAKLAAALEPSVDLFLCETMSCAREARNAALAARAAGRARRLPVYVSWTLNETPGRGLRSGESIAAGLDAVADLDIDGFLFNCTTPEAIAAGVETLAALTDRPVGGYPNRFHVPDGWTLDNQMQVERDHEPDTGGLRRGCAARHRAGRHALRRLLHHRSGGYCSARRGGRRGRSLTEPAPRRHQFSPKGRITASKVHAERGWCTRCHTSPAMSVGLQK